MKKTRPGRRILSLLLCVLLLVCSLPCLSACSDPPPRVEDVYDRVVQLITDAQIINTVFYGAGLPVYAYDSEYAISTQMYFGFADEGVYELVTEDAPFRSIDEMKAAAEKVYSADFLAGIYTGLFVGYAITDGAGTLHTSAPRYYEIDGNLYQIREDREAFDRLHGQTRVFDFSTMQIVKPSTSTRCYLSIASYLSTDPSAPVTEPITIVFRNGEWFLDSFCG